MHWLSERSLFFFAGSGCYCLCCGGPAGAGCCCLASGRSMLTGRCGLLACGIAFPHCGCLVLQFCELDSCLLRPVLWHRIKPEIHQTCKHDDICGRRKLWHGGFSKDAEYGRPSVATGPPVSQKIRDLASPPVEAAELQPRRGWPITTHTLHILQPCHVPRGDSKPRSIQTVPQNGISRRRP